MKLSIGIIGLPNVGKSTLFKFLSKQEVNIANYPFATIDPNIGVVAVPDERLEKLAKLSGSKKVVPAVVEFYDIAGLVKGAHKGEGLGNQFLSRIREVSAIVEVIRVFENTEIVHVEKRVDPVRDLEIVNTELVLKDLETARKRFEKLESEARGGDKQRIEDLKTAGFLLKGLNEGKSAADILRELSPDWREAALIKEMNLLTAKPKIYLLNGKESDASGELKDKIDSLGSGCLVIDLSDRSAEQKVGELIKKAYELLGLISFFTAGEDETRAWTIKKGIKAPEAAGTIHSDFEKKFVKAEAINWRKLLEAGSWHGAKQKGMIRLEGREYVVQDGDVMVIKHG